MFRGAPPLLKKGEWASDGHYAYLGMDHGQYKVFQGVFDMSKDQEVTGFAYDLNQKAIVIPNGTPFSKLQRLFDTLPKALKYHTGSKASIDVLFEDGEYINDLGTPLVLRDFSFQLNIKSLTNTVDGQVGTFVKPVVFQSDKAIEVYNSSVNFYDIRFEYSDEERGAISFLNSTTNIDDCCFDAKVNRPCVTDNGYNKIVFSDVYFKLNRNQEDSLLDKAAVGSVINIARSKSNEDFKPKSIVTSLQGGFIIAGNVEDLHISEKSPVYLPNGGVEIHGGFVTRPDGNIDIAVPTKLSQLENDMQLSNDYEVLGNKPTTITQQQAVAIEDAKSKRSYPKVDEEKLALIEKEATKGADWETNVSNKPVTISEEQSAAIEVNTDKRSYPQKDEEKLSEIEKEATKGADWETNVSNKPVTISEAQAAAIEDNTEKRTYPQKDEEKLSGIEEEATKGADWDTNITNKPVTISEAQAAAIEANTEKRSYPQKDEEKLSEIEKQATKGADWNTNVSNKPITISQEQAEAIAANTDKRSYPQKDEQKLFEIEKEATKGADWDTNIMNKPVTITLEQAAKIEANTLKRSYTEADEEKLSQIEEEATKGADWNTSVFNKPVTISNEQAQAIDVNSQKRTYPLEDQEKLSEIANKATKGANWNHNLTNIPEFLLKFIQVYEESGVFAGDDWETKLTEVLNFQISFMKNFVDAGVDSVGIDVIGNSMKLRFVDETEKAITLD